MVPSERETGVLDAQGAGETDPESFQDVGPSSFDSLLEAILIARDYEASHVTRGGQGKVRRLRNRIKGVDCAVKTALESEVGDTEFKRLQREAAILRRLNLPGVVQYVGYEVKDIVDKFAIPDREIDLYTKWIDGDTLEKVRDKQDITPKIIGNYRDQFFATLGELHRRGIFHRDLKPVNVVKTLDEKLVLLDLGLAKREGDLSLTGSRGDFIGTYNYTAPELREGQKATAASDIYAVGVTLVELLRGKAFDQVIDAADARLDLAEYGSRLDNDVRESLEAMLVDDPLQRMEKFRMVEGKYVFGKREVDIEDSIEQKNEERVVSFWQQEIEHRSSKIISSLSSAMISFFPTLLIETLKNVETRYIDYSALIVPLAAGLTGFIVAKYYDSAKTKLQKWWKKGKEVEDISVEDILSRLDNASEELLRLEKASQEVDCSQTVLGETPAVASIDDIVDRDKEKSVAENNNQKKINYTEMAYATGVGAVFGAIACAVGVQISLYPDRFDYLYSYKPLTASGTGALIFFLSSMIGSGVGAGVNYTKQKWGSITAGVKNLYSRYKNRMSLEERFKLNAENAVKYETKVRDEKIAKIGFCGLGGYCVGILANLIEIDYHHVSTPRGVGEIILGSVIGSGLGYLSYKWKQVPRLQREYGIEEKVEEPELKYYPAKPYPSWRENISRKIKVMIRSKKETNQMLTEMEDRKDESTRSAYLESFVNQNRLPLGKEKEYLAGLRTVAATKEEYTYQRELARYMVESYETKGDFTLAENVWMEVMRRIQTPKK